MPATAEDPVDGPQPDRHEEMQAATDELAARLDLSVLIEDRRQRPLWWATRGPVDGTRMRTILDRRVDRAAARVVRTFDLAHAAVPVHTPAMPELDMWARWCMPVHADGELLGLLWVLDPDERVTPGDLSTIVECAERAADVLARAEASDRDHTRRRSQLVRRLLRGPDARVAQELITLERLAADVQLQVDVTRSGGWPLQDGLRAHVAGDRPRSATSGSPLPLVQLAEAVRRAGATRTAVRAGARLEPMSWDALGAWRLIVDAPPDLEPAQLHPAVETLNSLPRDDLLTTARSVLDFGGDVAAAAERLHVHRTTLYYRLDRIAELTGVDLRSGRSRTDLQLALWLAAYRSAELGR